MQEDLATKGMLRSHGAQAQRKASPKTPLQSSPCRCFAQHRHKGFERTDATAFQAERNTRGES